MKLYTEEIKWRPRLENLQFRSLSEGSRKLVEQEFREEEIHTALMSCNGDKATRSDGFNMRFLQEF